MLSRLQRNSVYTALAADYADIGKISAEFPGKHAVDLILVHRIEWTRNKVCMNRARYLFRKGIAGSFLKWCLNGRYALFHMQLSRLPVGQPVVVVNTICNITALLGFENQSSSLDGMDASRIDLEEVAFFTGTLRINASH